MKINRNEIHGRAVKRQALGLLAVSLLALGGCAAQSPRPTAAPSADGFVTDQMSGTISSVDQNLKLLVALDRGDAGPRKDGFIGDTIAGAKAPNKAAPAMPGKAQPQTDLAKQQDQERLSYNRLALKARMKAQWDGSAADFLRQVAQTVDYRYQETGAATLPDIHLKQADSTVEQALSAAAAQISPAGSIKVLIGPRVICLVRSSSAEATCPAAFAR